MKEHRTKALRVTTTNNITRDSSDMFSSLQLLRLELDMRPCIQQAQDDRCCKAVASYHHCQEPKSISALLQDCVSCENVPMLISDLLISNTDCDHGKRRQLCGESGSSLSASLHFSCSLPPSVSPLLHRLCSSTSEFNRLCSNSQLPLQLLLTGDLQGNWSAVLNAVRSSRDHSALAHATDNDGNTALLVAGRRLLREAAWDRAAQLAQLLLAAGSDPNAANNEGRTLLSYSVAHMDDSLQLTRTLLNAGASVWPIDAECSAFTWFLRTVIRRRRLDDKCAMTLTVLSEVMGEQPTRMHAHVMRTMFRHAKCYKVLGPVFYQMKMAMMKHWSQPPSLQFLCRKAIRGAVGSKGITDGKMKQLGLPVSVHDYLLLD